MKGTQAHVNHFDYSTFLQYLTSIAGVRRNKSSAADIEHYYNFTGDCLETGKYYYDYLLNLQYLKAYMDYLEDDCELAPTTISEKSRLRLAIEFTLFLENPMENNAALFTRAHQILMRLSKWSKSLSKRIKEQRLKHSLISTKEVNTYCTITGNIYPIIQVEEATNPDEFLESKAVVAAVHEAFMHAENNMLTSRDHTLIISYIAAAIVLCTKARRHQTIHLACAEHSWSICSANCMAAIGGYF